MAEGKIPGNNAKHGESFTNWSVWKLGSTNMCMLNITGDVPLNADGITFTNTLPVQYRPHVEQRMLGKVYNGSNYVDCVIYIRTDGPIQVANMFYAKIDGIRLGFLRPSPIYYSLL